MLPLDTCPIRYSNLLKAAVPSPLWRVPAAAISGRPYTSRHNLSTLFCASRSQATVVTSLPSADHIAMAQTPAITIPDTTLYGGIASAVTKAALSITGGQNATVDSVSQDGRVNTSTTGVHVLYQAVQSPPLPYQLGSRVEHITTEAAGTVCELLSAELGVPQDIINNLIWFGAVYYCAVVPLPSKDKAVTLTVEHRNCLEQIRQRAVARVGKNPVYQTPRRVEQDVYVDGGYFRVHLHPKRFPVAHSTDWRSRILHNGYDYVVVNKPAGVQVSPTVDNIQESVLACTEKALDLPPGTLLPPHRLDAGTEGIVVLAKTSAFASAFRTTISSKGPTVRKLYRCLCNTVTGTRPALGPLVHYVLEGQRMPGEPSHTVVVQADTPGAHRCELEVLQAEEVELSGTARQQWGDRALEVTILLITGRTHQIRVQMAALGCPLLGDELYTALLQYGKLHRTAPEQLQQQPSFIATAELHRATTNLLQATQAVECQTSPDSCSNSQASPSAGVGAYLPANGSNTQSDPFDGRKSNEARQLPDTAAQVDAPLGAASEEPAIRQLSVPGAPQDQTEVLEIKDNSCQKLTLSAVAEQTTSVPAQSVRNTEQRVPRAADDAAWCRVMQEDPLKPFALQAFRLQVLHDSPLGTAPQEFTAGDPWWRCGCH